MFTFSSAWPAARSERTRTWPGKTGRPGKHGMTRAPATTTQARRTPRPDESLTLPDTPLYGTVRVDGSGACTPSSTATAAGSPAGTANCLSCAAPCCASSSSACPTAASRTRPCGYGTHGPAPLSLDELWRAYLARFDEEHAFKFAKSALGLTAARVRTPEQADRWVRLVMAAFAQLLLARPLAPDLRHPWETRPADSRPLPPGRVRRGFANIRAQLGTPAHVAKPARPGPGRPKGSTKGPAPRYPVPKKPGTTDQPGNTKPQVKG